MQIHLDKLGIEPSTWDETLEIDASTLDRVELIEIGEIDWRGRIWLEGPGFPLEARAEYEQSIACVRCLTPIVDNVSSEIQLMVFNRAPEPVEGEIELSPDDLEETVLPQRGAGYQSDFAGAAPTKCAHARRLQGGLLRSLSGVWHESQRDEL